MTHHGHPLGLHRVLKPGFCLPQAAETLNPNLPLYDNEILVNLSLLQIDAASFKSLIDKVSGDPTLSDADLKNRLAQTVKNIISERGKMHNPYTNSGGVFLGKVAEVGTRHPLKNKIKIGTPIVSLVSLTLTPLKIDAIKDIELTTDRVHVSGQAILFESGIFSSIPTDLPEGSVMAMLDVCGAPAQVHRHVKKDDTVFIMGLGKAGKSMASAAIESGAHVFGMDVNPQAVTWCQDNMTGQFEVIKDTSPLIPAEWLLARNNNKLADWVFNATNQEATEMNSILCCREGGSVMFFGMNTSFQRAVLGAEGIGRDVHLLMGSGYVPGHAEFALNLLRRNKNLRGWFDGTFI